MADRRADASADPRRGARPVRTPRRRRRVARRDRRRRRRAQADGALLVRQQGRLVDAVLATAAAQLSVVDRRRGPGGARRPLDRVDAVVRAVFRPAVRRPALLGLVREMSRLPEAPRRAAAPPAPAARRPGDRLPRRRDGRRSSAARRPPAVAALGYATVTGIATEPEALRAVGWTPDVAALRHLRDELRVRLPCAAEPLAAADVVAAGGLAARSPPSRTPTDSRAGSLPGFHLMLQPTLGRWSVLTRLAGRAAACTAGAELVAGRAGTLLPGVEPSKRPR